MMWPTDRRQKTPCSFFFCLCHKRPPVDQAGSPVPICPSPAPSPPPLPLLSPPQWSSQPIYVLDKDNDLDVPALARRNAADMVRVQPEGPYLVGGHSYGGAVAMEVAMVLESWGHTVGLVLVRAGEARPLACAVATPSDCLEMPCGAACTAGACAMVACDARQERPAEHSLG